MNKNLLYVCVLIMSGHQCFSSATGFRFLVQDLVLTQHRILFKLSASNAFGNSNITQNQTWIALENLRLK